MNKQKKILLTNRQLIYWRVLQVLVGSIGLGIFFLLIFIPKLGIHAFWNVLIPIAPALFVISAGIWRNICPLASTSLISSHFRFSKNKRLKVDQQAKLQLISVLLLFLIIPLRHTLFDTSGSATAILIGITALLAFYVSYQYDWKSAWCSGLCPVHPVEKLYGRKNIFVLNNAHCKSCVNCVSLCPDSTPAIHPLYKKKQKLSNKIAGSLMIGGFPGFIWGWFHVQDYSNIAGLNHIVLTYAYPLIAMSITLALFIVLKNTYSNKYRLVIIDLFATASISIYYWYRLPALFGFGIFPGDGMLVDLSHSLPLWFPGLMQISTTLFFTYWLIFLKKEMTSWLIRPPYDKRKKSIPNPINSIN